MAVGMLMMVPGATEEMYEQLNMKMFGGLTPQNVPEGLIVHTAGSTPEGWYVYDIWESKDHFDRFARGTLAPAAHAEAAGAPGRR